MSPCFKHHELSSGRTAAKEIKSVNSGRIQILQLGWLASMKSGSCSHAVKEKSLSPQLEVAFLSSKMALLESLSS